MSSQSMKCSYKVYDFFIKCRTIVSVFWAQFLKLACSFWGGRQIVLSREDSTKSLNWTKSPRLIVELRNKLTIDWRWRKGSAQNEIRIIYALHEPLQEKAMMGRWLILKAL